ncbi:unnamed protein product [Laminaria digitata]
MRAYVGLQQQNRHSSVSTGCTQKRKRVLLVALDAKAEGRPAQETRVANLEEEMGRLSLMKAVVEKERDNLVSLIFEGDEEGLLLAQQAELPGMLLQEKVGLQKMQLKQMERDMGDANKWGTRHKGTNESLRKCENNKMEASATDGGWSRRHHCRSSRKNSPVPDDPDDPSAPTELEPDVLIFDIYGFLSRARTRARVWVRETPTAGARKARTAGGDRTG